MTNRKPADLSAPDAAPSAAAQALPIPVAQATPAAELRGASRLLVAAVAGVADIVEDLHRTIAGVAPMLGVQAPGRTRGITGLVYRSVRGVAATVGSGLDAALAGLAPVLGAGAATPRREALRAALNGVLGDYLEATGNPLAIPMQLRVQGRPLACAATDADLPAGGRLLILVHGLCMNDRQWRRDGHDHGQALAAAQGYTPLYLHYNSGRPIHQNGAEFADRVERLLADWPTPVDEIVIIGHSMGGLVAESARRQAVQRGQQWPARLHALIGLGTPHLGAPLERAGAGVDWLLGISPYTAPLARLGRIRSAGIRDLGHGRILPAGRRELPGRAGKDGGDGVDSVRQPSRLLIAASKQAEPGTTGKRPSGDGLVPVASALAQGPRADAVLAKAQRRVVFGIDHFDLLASREVHQHLCEWLDAVRRRPPKVP